MILKTIFVLCLTLKIFGSTVPVEEIQPTVAHCQRVLDKEVSFGHRSLMPMTFEERTHGYEYAFRNLWQRLAHPTGDYVNIIRSLTKFAGWSSAAPTIMTKVGCTYDDLLAHIDRASAVTETVSASRNLVVAKARLMRLKLESKMSEKTIAAYAAADTDNDRFRIYTLLASVMDGNGVKVRFIEMAQLVSVCGYSPCGERSHDLDFASEIIRRYFDVSPRSKRHFDMLGAFLPRTHTAPVSPHVQVIPVPYVTDEGEIQRARTTLNDITTERDTMGEEPAVIIHAAVAPISPTVPAAGAPIAVVALSATSDLTEGEKIAMPLRRHAETDDTDSDEEVTRLPQRRRVALTDLQKKDIETFLNAGWAYSKIAEAVRCSLHEVTQEEAELLSKNG